jgi:tight adherence protein B
MNSEILLLGTILIAATTMTGFIATQILGTKYVKYQGSYTERMSDRMENLFLGRDLGRKLLWGKWALAFAMMVVGAYVTNRAGGAVSALIAVLFALAGFYAPDYVPAHLEKKRLRKFNEQLPDTLVTMASCLKSGLAFPQSVDFLAANTDAPTCQEFGLMAKEVKVGVDVDTALRKMFDRMFCEDLELLVTAVTISRQVGGNLVEIFDKMAETIRDRAAMQGKIRALTAQGKMQTVVIGLMPIAMFFMIRFVQPELMANLTETAIGWMLIVGAAIWETIGLFIIKKIVTIEV